MATVFITAHALNVRDTPNGNVSSALFQGDHATVDSYAVNTWLHTTAPHVGYIYADVRYVQLVDNTPAPTPQPVPTGDTIAVRTNTSLNVRTGPGLSYGVVTVLAANTIVTVYAHHNVQADGHNWYNVASADVRWIAGDLTSPVNGTPAPVPGTPPPPVPPPATGHAIKIGLHIETPTNGNILAMAQRLKAAGKPLGACVVLDDVGLANALSLCVRYVVFRSSPAGQTFQMDKLTDVDAAKRHAVEVWANHQASITALDKNVIIQTRNEAGINQFDYAYELQMMQLADSAGRKIGMFADSVGTPNVDQWQWRIPALRYAAAHGHAAILHEYGAFVGGKVSSIPVSDSATRQWYGTRHEGLYNSVPSDCRPLLIIGETGTSDGYPHGEQTITDLGQYNSLLQNDSYCGGFCLWGMGNSAYNANGLLPAIEALVLRS